MGDLDLDFEGPTRHRQENTVRCYSSCDHLHDLMMWRGKDLCGGRMETFIYSYMS